MICPLLTYADMQFIAAARWLDPAEDAACMAAARRYAASLEPFAAGAYVNALTDEGEPSIRRAYPKEKLARLTARSRIGTTPATSSTSTTSRRHHRDSSLSHK